MKSCAKCGQVVANGTQICPKCGSFAFHTDNGSGSEGLIAELLNMLMFKNPKLFWILIMVCYFFP